MLDETLLTADGFLKNPQDWTPDIAKLLANQQNLELVNMHWQVIAFVRSFYADYGYSPIQRIIVKYLQSLEPSANSITLQHLFPQGPRQICLLAGLPKPARCV